MKLETVFMQRWVWAFNGSIKCFLFACNNQHILYLELTDSIILHVCNWRLTVSLGEHTYILISFGSSVPKFEELFFFLD